MSEYVTYIFILIFIIVTRKRHSLQVCFFVVFIQEIMAGSHNSKYYAKSLRRSKVKSHNITKLFKKSRSENISSETHEIENIQDEPQTEQEAIVEQLEEYHFLF